MQAVRLIGLGALLAVVSTAAMAFQEQQQGASSAPAKAAPAAGAAAPVATPLAGLPSGSGKSEGIDIRIPGLGSLGVLPKMDFGLELLYGAADLKANDDSRALPSNADDLAIKGTLRRKF